MRRLTLAMLLLGMSFGRGLQAQDDEVRPVYIYLEVEDAEDSNADVPLALYAFLTEVTEQLTRAGQRPIIVAASPEDLGDPLSSIVMPDSQFDDIFENSPYRALSVRFEFLEQYFNRLFLTPFLPLSNEYLPIGHFGFVPSVGDEFGALPSYTVDLAIGMALYIIDDCEDAVPHFQIVTAADSPNNFGPFIYSAARFYEANCQYALGEVETASSLFQEIIEYETENASDNTYFHPLWFTDRTALNLATIYIEQGNNEKALELLDVYHKYQPTNLQDHNIQAADFENFFVRADLYLALDEPGKVVGEMTMLIDYVVETGELSDMHLAWLYTERGYRYELLGETEAALTDYERAISTASDYPVVYYRRGLMLKGHLQQEGFEQFLAIAPDFELFAHPPLDTMIEDVHTKINQ